MDRRVGPLSVKLEEYGWLIFTDNSYSQPKDGKLDRIWKNGLTDLPSSVIADFLAPDDVPDARHPVGTQGKGAHQQRQQHEAVLGISVYLLDESDQSEKPR